MKKISKIIENIVPVKVGVIGIGNMGWHHARVLSLLKDAELVGVADLDLSLIHISEPTRPY